MTAVELREVSVELGGRPVLRDLDLTVPGGARLGLIGFVGIIVPHTVRLVAGTSYRRLIPLSLVGGAAFLIRADLVARTVAAPAELPIGVVTAFFGAPFFALVLRTARRAP